MTNLMDNYGNGQTINKITAWGTHMDRNKTTLLELFAAFYLRISDNDDRHIPTQLHTNSSRII